jgi:hypothetical protein
MLKNQIRTILGFLLFALLVLQFSCALAQQNASNYSISQDNQIDLAQSESKAIESEFEANRRLWSEGKITNYRITVEAFQNGLYIPRRPVIIDVRDGQVVSIKPAPSSEQIGGLEPYKFYDTIEKIFDRIEQAEKQRADKIEVEYDSKLGYPKNLRIDQRLSGADDELLLRILKFEILR